MPVCVSDFVDQAERLKASDQEIDWRTSICRSYYAVYHQAVDLAKVQGFKAVPPSVHKQLFDFLKVKYPSKQSIMRRIQVMRKRRNDADYEIRNEISKNIACQQLAESKLLIDALNKF